MSLSKYTNWYQQNIGSKPLLEIPLAAGIAGLGTYAVADQALDALSNFPGMSKLRTSTRRRDQDEDELAATKRRLAIMAALLAGGATAYAHADLRGSGKELVDSLTQSNYWTSNPNVPARKALIDRFTLPGKSPEAIRAEYENSMRNLYKESMDKTAGEFYDEIAADPTFHDLNIPVVKSINVVREDPYLLPSSKGIVSGLVSQSSPDDPYTSKFGLVKTALKAGADYGTAYMFGQGVGSLLAMPSTMVNKLSQAGGMAYAVINSGILKAV